MGVKHSIKLTNFATELEQQRNNRKNKRSEQSDHTTQEWQTQESKQCYDFPKISPELETEIIPSNSKGDAQKDVQDNESIRNNRRRYSDIICVRARLLTARRRNSSPISKERMTPKSSIKDIYGANFPENTPCHPDLITCCKNVATFLSEAVANSNSNSRRQRARPSAEYIYSYMRILFAILQLESECCVYADIYLRRLLSNSKGKVAIHAGNWHKILVGACLLASKYVDDLSMDNKDFSAALTGCSVQFMNQLESKYLHILNWQLHVPISEYTTRYFELARKRNDERDWDALSPRVKPHFTVRL